MVTPPSAQTLDLYSSCKINFKHIVRANEASVSSKQQQQKKKPDSSLKTFTLNLKDLKFLWKKKKILFIENNLVPRTYIKSNMLHKVATLWCGADGRASNTQASSGGISSWEKPVTLCKAFYSLLTYCIYLTQEREVPGDENSEPDKVDLFFRKEVLRKHPKVSCTINRSKAGWKYL